MKRRSFFKGTGILTISTGLGKFTNITESLTSDDLLEKRIVTKTQVNKTNLQWYEFSPDDKECVINNSDLPTPWLNRLSNDVFTTWVTHHGYIEGFLIDPVWNGLTNPQNVSGHFYITDKDSRFAFQINKPTNDSRWECRVGLGYNKISNIVGGLESQVTYFVPREDNALVMIVDIKNITQSNKSINVFGQVEWNLGDPTKSFIRRGDGRGGSQFNLYKKVYMENNVILARQLDWRNTHDCIVWPYSGFFAVNETVRSYETIKEKFLGVKRDYDLPAAVENGQCSNTDFWSQGDYPIGVLHNTIDLQPGGRKSIVYVLGMARDEEDIKHKVTKYSNVAAANKALEEVKSFYSRLVEDSIYVQTPDKENDRIINIWTKYMWRQFWKKDLNNGAYGLGLWGYGLERGNIGSTPEQFLLPFDMDILKNSILNLLHRQLSDTSQNDLFTPDAPAMLYKDLGLKGPNTHYKGYFKVPYEKSIYNMFSIYYYLLETGDLKLLNALVPYADGKEGTVWEHIRTGLTITTNGISERGLPRVPTGLGDWLDEFTQICINNNAESVMLGGQICFLLKGFSEIATETGHTDDAKRWMILYQRIKDAVNKIAWDEEWYIRAFSDRASPLIPIGGYRSGERRIFLNAQSWSILSGIASSKQAARSLASVKKHLMSDYGPMLFYPSYSHYIDYIGTQSIYAPGFRNACIYPRPAGWAIAAACLSDHAELANEMYNNASLVSRAKDMVNFECEPYAYTENFVGPDNRLRGKGEFQWNLGEGASWMWTSYVNYILGVRPVLNGLLIDPKIPSEWPGFKIKRPFRGCVYDVTIKNPEKVSSGVASVRVDGRLINGSTINAFNDGKTHIVEANMGRS